MKANNFLSTIFFRLLLFLGVVIGNFKNKISHKTSLITFNIILLFCLIGQVKIVYAQGNCGTRVTAEQIAFEKATQAERNAVDVEQARLMPNYIPVKIHILRTSTGAGGVTPSSILSALNTVNQYFSPNNMIFQQCGNINYINNTTFYNNDIVPNLASNLNQTSDVTLAASNNVSNVVNIYFVPNSPGYCGWTYFPSAAPSRDWIIMNNACINSGVLAHELGHYFHLYHTHDTSMGAENVTRISSSNCYNCNTAGDLLCDTPADPGLRCYSNVVSSTCSYIGSTTDLCENRPHSPQTNNIMSYSCHSCLYYFSQGQLSRMLQSYMTNRSYLNSNACNSSQPDLNIQTANISPVNISSGGTLNLNYTIRNIGTATAGYSYTRFYLSNDCAYSSNDTYIGQRYLQSLSAGVSSTVSNYSLNIPTSIPAGIHYLIIKADGSNTVSESNENNNTSCHSFNINSIPTTPDLSIQNCNTNPTSITVGNTTSVSYSVKNIGAVTSGYSYTRFYLSNDCTYSSNDIYIGQRYLQSLSAGATSNVSSHQVSIPTNISPGNYRLIIKTDGSNLVTESSESNNTCCIPITVTPPINVGPPDLKIAIPNIITTSVTAGGTISTSCNDHNIGLGTAGAHKIKYWLSTNCTYDSNDVYLGFYQVSSLNAGVSILINKVLTIPSNTPSGTYRIIFKTDADNDVPNESNENNNTACSYLDSFTVINPTCNAPTNTQISATNISATIARLNMSPISGTIQYDWQYRVQGGSWINLSATTVNYKYISSLQACTDYEFQVKRRCSAGNWSNWSTTKAFRTADLACNAPTINQLNVNSITPITASLSCSNTGYSNYMWEYRRLGTTPWLSNAPNTNPSLLSNLTPNTTYQYRLKVQCSPCNNWSNWSSIGTFTTLSNNPACPIFMFLSNPADNISSGTVIKHEVNQVITASNEVQSGADVIYDAGTRIVLRPNFIAEAGSDFLAVIDGCGGAYKTGEPVDYTNIDTPSEIPIQIAPNPFSQQTQISFSLTENTLINLDIYNLTGQKIATLAQQEERASGKHQFTFDGNNLANGTYLVRLQIGNQLITKKLILLK